MSEFTRRLELDAGRVTETVEQLQLRIHARFPESGLEQVCGRLVEIAKETAWIVRRIQRPIYVVRAFTLLIILGFLGLLALIVYQWFPLMARVDSFEFSEIITITEAGINEMILLALGFFYLTSLEVRIKRRRVIAAINRLRNIAHIIDMHQLTKDPDTQGLAANITVPSPKRTLSAFELSRYLDYCSEMLSLASKLGYIYIANFNDPSATAAANELESLSSGLSRKIWQKIMIVRMERR